MRREVQELKDAIGQPRAALDGSVGQNNVGKKRHRYNEVRRRGDEVCLDGTRRPQPRVRESYEERTAKLCWECGCDRHIRRNCPYLSGN